jgi:hypothetical protein
MGGGSGGMRGESQTSHLETNLKKAASQGFSHVSSSLNSSRTYLVARVSSQEPLRAAESYFKALGKGGNVAQLANGKGLTAKLKDGSRIVFRPSSRDGSPVIEIHPFRGSTISRLKIHFVKDENG